MWIDSLRYINVFADCSEHYHSRHRQSRRRYLFRSLSLELRLHCRLSLSHSRVSRVQRCSRCVPGSSSSTSSSSRRPCRQPLHCCGTQTPARQWLPAALSFRLMICLCLWCLLFIYVWNPLFTAQFAITININVCPHIRVPNMPIREAYTRRHRNI